ncbi:MAG: hypothetical protein IPL25_06555 [Saprospiraceae bacterium]|nr:hypothetical protein [Candidatus Vicinibacter affinis]
MKFIQCLNQFRLHLKVQGIENGTGTSAVTVIREEMELHDGQEFQMLIDFRGLLHTVGHLQLICQILPLQILLPVEFNKPLLIP